MSEHMRYPTIFLRKFPPPGHYDDYKLGRVRQFVNEGRLTTAILEAHAIYDRTKYAAALEIIGNRTTQEDDHATTNSEPRAG